MRIVFITTKFNFVSSGASSEELDLKIRAFQEAGAEVCAVTVYSDANNMPDVLPYPVHTECVTAYGLLSLQLATYRILKKFTSQADIFFIDGQVFLYGAGLYRLLGGKKPVFAHFNRELTGWPENVSSYFGVPSKSIYRRIKEYIRFYIEKWIGMPLANRLDALSFTNPYLRDTYRRFGLRVKDALVVGDAFEYQKFMARYGVTESTYQDRNKEKGPFTIYYSSRMAAGKGFDTLIAAFAKIRDKENFKLILGGEGPEDDRVRRYVHELGLDAFTTFTGWAPKSEHYARLTNECDIFVQPSQSGLDKTSYILLEAMAFGIPSVLPKGGGLEWDAKESALYFEPGDIEDLAQKIELLGSDRELRTALSTKCYKRLNEEEMNHHSHVKNMLELMHASLP